MALFQVKSDLSVSQQKEMDRILAIPEAQRLESDAAFLTALAPYLTNQVVQRDARGFITLALGETLPTDFEGFSKGALFIELDAEGNGLYVNTGDESEAAWEAASVSTSPATAIDLDQTPTEEAIEPDSTVVIKVGGVDYLVPVLAVEVEE